MTRLLVRSGLVLAPIMAMLFVSTKILRNRRLNKIHDQCSSLRPNEVRDFYFSILIDWSRTISDFESAPGIASVTPDRSDILDRLTGNKPELYRGDNHNG